MQAFSGELLGVETPIKTVRAPKGVLYVIVVGCGRTGAYIANRLSKQGYSVVVIDENESSFGLLSDTFSGFRVEGDATEFALLKQVKMEQADAVFAATVNDNINIMVAQVAKSIFRVPKVIARVNETEREEVFTELGIDTINPPFIVGEAIFDVLAE